MFNSSNTPYPKFPNMVECFKEDMICELLTIQENNPKMERILGMFVWPKVNQIDLIKTRKGYSNEGQKIGGYKLVVEVSFQEKLTYIAYHPEQSLSVKDYIVQKSIFITLPEQINGRRVCDLYRMKKFDVRLYIEKVYTRMLDDRHLHNCVLLLVNLKVNE